MGWSLVHIQHGRGLQDEFDQTFRPHTFPLAAESSFQVAGPAATDRDCARPLAGLRRMLYRLAAKSIFNNSVSFSVNCAVRFKSPESKF